MLFTNAVVAFLSVTVVSASPIQRRSAATVLADITVISSDIATLQTGVNAYTGTIAQSLALSGSANTLSSKIESTTTDVTASGTFDAADSTSITTAINNITPTIITLLGAVASKGAITIASGFGPVFVVIVQNLKTNTDALFSATETAVSVVPANVVAVKADQARIDAAFNATIAAL